MTFRMIPFVLASLSTITVAFADTPVGVSDIALNVDHHDRPIQGAIWYPAQPSDIPAKPYGENPVFYGTHVHQDAPSQVGTHPLVLLSHGLGGNIRAMAWLSAGLAERGAIVISINHPNSSTWDFDIQQGLRHGTRAQDLSAALDWAERSDFAQFLDADQIMAAGFSYGGWTALSLGGIKGNLPGYIEHCQAYPEKSSHCADLLRAALDLGSLDADVWSADYSDPRVTQVVAIDPGLIWGLTARDVADLNVPVSLIAMGTGENRLFATDFSDQGSGFGALLPQASQMLIDPAAHFSVLPLCKPMGAAILQEENDDPVCTDPDGADRAKIHAQIIDLIATDLGL